MERLTGVVNNINKASALDRKLLKDETKAMAADLNKAVINAIQVGEAKAKAVQQRIAEHQKKTKRFLQVELTEACERAADATFKALQGNRQKLADNYLSLKAYSVASVDKVFDYVKSGKGRNLSSIGDLLMTVAMNGSIKTKKAYGLGFGSTKVPPLFAGKGFKTGGKVATVNALTNEYTKAAGAVRTRWPMGLGKYLLDRLEVAMLGKGVLQVDKLSGKAGNYVYVNGHSVGLSNKLNDFSKLGCRITVYESTLAKMTSQLTALGKNAKKRISVKPPEWQGKL